LHYVLDRVNGVAGHTRSYHHGHLVMTVLSLNATSAAVTTKAAPALFDQLDKALKSEGEDLVKKTKVAT
jgi:hypothetical protein